MKTTSRSDTSMLHSTVCFATSEANHVERLARWLDGRCQECGAYGPYVAGGRACVDCLDREVEEANAEFQKMKDGYIPGSQGAPGGRLFPTDG